MHVARRKTGCTAKRRSRHRWIEGFVYVADERGNTECLSCRMREVQIPAKFCTSRTEKRSPSPKSRREVKKTGLFCTSRMEMGTATRDFYRIGHFQSLLLIFSANKRHSSYPGADFSCTWTYSGPDFSWIWTSPVPELRRDWKRLT